MLMPDLFTDESFGTWRGVPGSAQYLRERWAKEHSDAWVWRHGLTKYRGCIVERWQFKDSSYPHRDCDKRWFIFSVEAPNRGYANPFEDFTFEQDADSAWRDPGALMALVEERASRELAQAEDALARAQRYVAYVEKVRRSLDEQGEA